MKPKKYYIAGCIETKKEILSNGSVTGSLVLKWAEGQVGACAVFTNKRKAEKYAGKGSVIVGYGDVVQKETKAND